MFRYDKSDHQKFSRNDPCICGSGRKFKTCCMRTTQKFMTNTEFVPFLQFPLAIQMLVSISDEEILSDGPKYWPLSVVGATVEATTFEHSTQEIEKDQILRVGFCNREYRLLVQVRTNYGIEELRANDTLGPGTYAVVVSFDNIDRRIKLFVDRQLVQESDLRGSLAFHIDQQFTFGHGNGATLWCCHFFRTRVEQTSVLFKGICAPPNDTSCWLHSHSSVTRLFLTGEHPNCAASMWFSNYFIFSHRASSDDARRFLSMLNGGDTVDLPDNASVAATASKGIRTITDGLESIVQDSSKDENDLLAYFRRIPAAAFLLDPFIHRQWREQEIQRYGRIDFVFEICDGTFRVVEIESHTQQLFTKANEFAQPFRHAMEQVKTWLRGVAKSPFIANRHFGSSEQDAYRGLLVIGRKSEINNTSRTERWLAERSQIEVLTWDDILARGDYSNEGSEIQIWRNMNGKKQRTNPHDHPLPSRLELCPRWRQADLSERSWSYGHQSQAR